MQTNSTLPQVYIALKSLAHKHIIDFVPQKRTPYVRYMQRREDSRHLMFPPMAYDTLKEQFAKRIDAMAAYVTATNKCRSRMLLAYLGEEGNDCGQCDVCLDRRSTTL